MSVWRIHVVSVASDAHEEHTRQKRFMLSSLPGVRRREQVRALLLEHHQIYVSAWLMYICIFDVSVAFTCMVDVSVAYICGFDVSVANVCGQRGVGCL